MMVRPVRPDVPTAARFHHSRQALDGQTRRLPHRRRRAQGISRTIDATGARRLDAVVALADEIAAATLPVTAVWVLLAWPSDHEIADLTLYSPGSIDAHRLWSAQVGVPVQILADACGKSAAESLTRS